MEIKENCGLLGLSFADLDIVESLEKGIFQLQHRGQEHCGVAVTNGTDMNAQTYRGLISDNLIPENLIKFSGTSGIAHTSLLDPQPFVLESILGKFAICFSGNIINSADIKAKLMSEGVSFSSDYDVEVLAKIIARASGIIEGLESLAEQVIGAFTCLVLFEDGRLYAIRGPLGIKPLVVGTNKYGTCVASESSALNWLGMDIIQDVEPGAIHEITPKGSEKKGEIVSSRIAHCAFEYAYTARLDSIIEGVPINLARSRLGKCLAEKDEIESTVVAGVPMSGLGHALGYHQESGVPYGIVFDYNRYALGRSYIPPTQKERVKIADRKLYPVKAAITGQYIVLCDDSIVRGTQIGDRVKELMELGAKEVHVRIGAPKLNYPCKYEISTRTQDELIGHHRTEEDVRDILGATTLKYNSVDDFVKAIGIPREKLCLACWTGEYPS